MTALAKHGASLKDRAGTNFYALLLYLKEEAINKLKAQQS